MPKRTIDPSNIELGHFGPNFSFLLLDLSRAVTLVYDDRLKSSKLTKRQWRTIECVAANPGISQIKLAEDIGLGRMAVTGIVTRLESKKLLTRKSDAVDRRAKKVYCTAKARKLLPKMQEVCDATMTDLLAGIPKREQKQLISNLVKMYERAQYHLDILG